MGSDYHMINKLRTIVIALFVFFGLVSLVFPQDIQTAAAMFSQLAERYGQLYDYSSNVSINVDGQKMGGRLYWKKKSRLRIDFTSPSEQVIVSNGELLQVYIPKYNVTLTQKLDPSTNTANMASAEGLSLLRKGYNISFKTGPQPVPLDEGGTELVNKLLLTWKNTNQGFRQIELSVTPSRYIRRLEGITSDRRVVRLDFYGMSINQGIADIAFDYDSPPESNKYDSFLFGNTN